MRKTGQNDPTTCLEEGEAVRFAHLEQQKAIDRSGCEEQYFRDFQKEFKDCMRDSGKLNLYYPEKDPLRPP